MKANHTPADRVGAAQALRALAAAIERHPDLEVRGTLEAVRWRYPTHDDILAAATGGMRLPDAEPITTTISLGLEGR